MFRPGHIGWLRPAFHRESLRQVIGHVVLFHAGVMDIDRNRTFLLGDKRVFRVRLEEQPRQEEAFASGGAKNATYPYPFPHVCLRILASKDILELRQPSLS